MSIELIIGLAGLIGWGIVCSYYLVRDRYVTLSQLLPFVVFMILIGIGVGQL